jgi:hypothetical protein
MRSGVVRVGVLVVVLVVGGCSGHRSGPEPTEPELSTAGALRAQDLGPGDWSMNGADFPKDLSVGHCSWFTARLGMPSYSSSGQVSLWWTDGDVSVNSTVYGMDDFPADWISSLQDCMESTDPVEEGTVTAERRGDVTVVHAEQVMIRKDGSRHGVTVIDEAVTVTSDGRLVVVSVSHAKGVVTDVDPVKLLPVAVKRAAELPLSTSSPDDW